MAKSQTLKYLDLRKNVPILQEGGSTPVPPTLLVIRVVLLHNAYGVLNPLILQLYMLHDSLQQNYLHHLGLLVPRSEDL